MEDNKYIVYMHLFPNNKAYVGITGLNVADRWKHEGNGYNKQPLIFRAINKYGWDNIQHIILEENLSLREANEFEKCYIALFETNNRMYGYNITRGGDGLGMHTKESKELMSRHRKGKQKSVATRKNMSDAFIGRVMPIGARNVISIIKRENPISVDKSEYKIPVVQMNMENQEIVAVYPSIKDAHIKTGLKSSHICECCKFRRRQEGGFKWAYKSYIDEGGDPFTVKTDYTKRSVLRHILMVDRATGEILAEYKSIRGAAQVMGVSEGGISRSIHSDRYTAYGYRWYFKDEYIPPEEDINIE